jgi:hypothetical protein
MLLGKMATLEAKYHAGDSPPVCTRVPNNEPLTIFGQSSPGEFGGVGSMKDRWMATKVASAKLDAFLERAAGEFSPSVNDRESFGRISSFIAQARSLQKNSDQN